MRIFCRECGVELTKELIELTDTSLLCIDDKKDYIPEGFYFKNTEDNFLGLKGMIIINIHDVVNVKNHSDPDRLNGCCGLDGCDGINKVCINDHEVATEKSDCWMPHCIIFDKERVTLT